MMSGILWATVVVALQVFAVHSCRTLVPDDLLNGCIFDGLDIEAPSTGFQFTQLMCYDVVHRDEFREQPYVYFSKANADIEYLLMMVDADAPDHEVGQFYLHWMLPNVPGAILKQGLAQDIFTPLMSYVGPDPLPFSGVHRYMILAYEQLFTLGNVPGIMTRSQFSPIIWFETFGGENAIRGPVAAIGFKSEYE